MDSDIVVYQALLVELNQVKSLVHRSIFVFQIAAPLPQTFAVVVKLRSHRVGLNVESINSFVAVVSSELLQIGLSEIIGKLKTMNFVLLRVKA